MARKQEQKTLCDACEHLRSGRCLNYNERLAISERPVCYCDGFRKKPKESK